MLKTEQWLDQPGEAGPIRQNIVGQVVNTIDASTNEPTSHFLANARLLDPRARAHHNIQEVGGNLCALPGLSVLRITGHGGVHLICCGGGQDTLDNDHYMGIKNPDNWAPVIGSLRGLASVMELWSCHTGAEVTGAQFLSMMADRLGAPVKGLTGFVAAERDRMHFEIGSKWQQAFPGQGPPPPIASPTGPPVYNLRRIVHGAETLDLDQDDVRKAVFEPAHEAPLDVTRQAREAGWGEPVRIKGELAALVTGRLVLTLKAAGGEVEKRLIVFNDRLLRDEAPDGAYYRASSTLSDALAGAS